MSAGGEGQVRWGLSGQWGPQGLRRLRRGEGDVEVDEERDEEVDREDEDAGWREGERVSGWSF